MLRTRVQSLEDSSFISTICHIQLMIELVCY